MIFIASLTVELLTRQAGSLSYSHKQTRPDTEVSGRVKVVSKRLVLIRSLSLPVLTLGGERRAAAAAAGCIRVLEGETRTHDVGDIVDFHAVQVLRAEHIDEQAHAFLIQNEIALPRILFDIQTVLKSRAAAGHHAHAQSRGFRQSLFARHKLF